jgi:hypothetical protein
VRAHLQAALDRCSTLEEWKATVKFNHGFNAGHFARMKEEGVGKNTLTNFLGERWRNRVITALVALDQAQERPRHSRRMTHACKLPDCALRCNKLWSTAWLQPPSTSTAPARS